MEICTQAPMTLGHQLTYSLSPAAPLSIPWSSEASPCNSPRSRSGSRRGACGQTNSSVRESVSSPT